MSHPLTHGIDTYFHEYFANRRRVSGLLFATSALLFSTLLLISRRHPHNDDLDILDPKRFGFEGPKQWVERIRLEQLAQRDTPGLFAITYLTAEARKGGKRRDPTVARIQPLPVAEKPLGEGDAERDLLARARMLARETPVVRSEDLIIERLVRPEYPSEAREQNIEGVVEALALVDTTDRKSVV